jgi:hypothetical protein
MTIAHVVLYRSIATNNRILLRDSHVIIIRPVLLVTDLRHMLVQEKTAKMSHSKK